MPVAVDDLPLAANARVGVLSVVPLLGMAERTVT
jgi:hypothetical protein